MKNTDHGIDIVIIQEYFVDRTVLEDRKLKKKKKPKNQIVKNQELLEYI